MNPDLETRRFSVAWLASDEALRAKYTERIAYALANGFTFVPGANMELGGVVFATMDPPTW